ncbi:hypothetical protein [Escherichia coli]|nr:hypothetical protein [Escherichia coli]
MRLKGVLSARLFNLIYG